MAIFWIILSIIGLYWIFKVPYDIKGEEEEWRRDLGLDN